MNKITELNLIETLEGLKNKQFSAVELVNEYINNIKVSRAYNAFITETFDLALERASESDKKISQGQAGELEGVPVAVKDLFCTKGVRTTNASRMLENFVPSYESTVTEKLWNSGALMIGKANMDEFAMGSSNTTSFFGPVINPHKAKNSNIDLVPGGSSGGSAVAVAANLCVAATGSDTGGSIRQPASFTGTVGLKPTYGRCSRYGMIAFASSLDQAGVFTKSVTDAALLLKIISGLDKKDSTSMDMKVPDFKRILTSNIEGKRIGVPLEYKVEGMPVEIEKLWDQGIKTLEAHGANVVDISLPHTKYAPAVYYIIASAECSSNLARFDGVRYGYRSKTKTDISLDQMYEMTRSEGFGDEVKRRIMLGTYVLSAGYYDAYYRKAGKVRKLIYQDFKKAFEQVDAILTPTTPNAAFPVDKSLTSDSKNPLMMYLNDAFTVPASLAGVPAMSVPVGFNLQGLPLGLQVISNHFDEESMLNIALALEQNH